jgi:bleomycin hydrolase
MKFKTRFAVPLLGLCLLFQQSAYSQTDTAAEEEKAKIDKFEFTIDKDLDHTEVKSQDQTGTCWCFATASFIESELMRQGKGRHELSEMFIVKNVYKDKAFNYVLRQGKANFGEGALAHDFINAAGKYGLVPDEIYTGLVDANQQHNHSEMVSVLESMLKSISLQRKPGTRWDDAFAAVLDAYLGSSPATFSYQGKDYTPLSFAQALGFNADDYISFTSFSHHPFGRPFVLEIPDNFSNGSFQNIPIDDLVSNIDHALDNGYTVAWDGDVSERGFSTGNGLALLPAPDRRDGMKVPGDELEVTPEMRQSTFEDLTTTDDHLMHLVGRAHDQLGKKYYIIKNSWGPASGPYNGYLYMSEAYVRLKTIAILVHKDAVAPPLSQPAAEEPAHASPEPAGGR